MKALWAQMKFQKDLILTGTLVMLGMFVFGTILHDVILVSGDEVDSVFCMGSFMALIVMCMMMFFFAGIHMVQIFNYAVAMGQTRKRTFPLYTIATFLTFAVLELILKLMNVLEKWRLGRMFPGLEIEDFLEEVIGFNALLAFALVGTAIGVLLGASISRFGKAAFWVWWVLFMVVCIGGPRLTHYVTEDYPDSPFVTWVNGVLAFVMAHAEAVGVAAVIAATVIFTGIAYLLVRRQQVNV
ncbi:MAG: hypothetical protein PUK75_10125 [bacterium]|nr:hypothetical protein [bacterium]MDY4098886.1 hypothetical protein [Lachnospiraceae bacterium]